LDAYFSQVLVDWDLPGMTIGIVYDGNLVFSKGYGVKELGKAEAPDANTLFAVASNTKAVTATLIGMLVDDGLLSWEDKVKYHLPYFTLNDPWITSQATIADLLCHRIGFGTFSGDVIWYKSNKTSEEIIRRLEHLPMAFEFRAGYGYSNLMYIVAGEVIEKVTGKSWEENVRERILEPLGMDRTIVKLEDLTTEGNFASPHARINNRNEVIEWVDWEEVAATGGLISSIKDMASWMIFNMNKGIWNGDTLISARQFNQIFTPHNNFLVDHTRPNDFNRNFRAYGLGWGLADYHGHFIAGHTGGFDGMISEVRMLPKERIGVIVLTNGAKSPIGAITNYTLETLLGKSPRNWSAEMLPRAQREFAEHARITEIRNTRVANTQPWLKLEAYAGKFYSEIYGYITVKHHDGNLRLYFEHSPGLSASLHHWHFNTWEIRWDEPQAWFGFGTLQFDINNKMEVTGLTFDVPNRDIFFEELKPVKR
ncbi:MAG TPA: serine hydrolase, partial [Bacteroidales bacterium]|nr:serine hydrolase [Bacteroidales bacterium]